MFRIKILKSVILNVNMQIFYYVQKSNTHGNKIIPLAALHANGNCSHVDVDLNSLNKFEKEIRTTNPSSATVSR